MTFSLSRQLMRASSQSGATTKIIDPHRQLGWRALAEEVARFAGVLQKLGISDGDRVAILALNSSEYLSLYLAVPWAGGIAVPVNTRLAAAEVIHWLNDSGSTVLIIDKAFVELIQDIRSDMESVQHVVCLGTTEPGGSMPAMNELLKGVEPVRDAQRRDNDVAILFYTGGTTGKSKGVPLTHKGLVFAGLQWAHAVGVNSSDTLAIIVPMFHLAAGLNSIAALMLASGVVILPGFEPAETLRAIERHRISKLALVPTILDMLISAPEFDATDVSSL